jgi:AraC family transcriptional regulator
MVLMRIGGDEFALVTDFDDETAARAVADEILAKNGEPVMFEGRALPLSLWCGMARVPEHPRYAELFTAMHAAVEESKK